MTQPDTTAPSYAEIFFSFLRLGSTAFGGPAIVPHIRALAVTQKRWLDEETFDRGNVFAQIVPGAISVQVTAYVGLQLRGLRGAAAACAGFILPAFLFMLCLSALYMHWRGTATITAAFQGLRVVVIAILAHASCMAARSYIKSRFDAAIALAAALLFGAGINPVLVLLAAGSAGLFLRAGVQASEAANRQRPFRALQALALLGVVGAGWVFLSRMDQRLAELGLLMLRIDLFAFGGGYTSVPFMFHEVVEVRRWLSGPELLDGIALGQLTPGPIVITATFVGYLLQGLAGACVATIHVFLPSFFIVALLAPLVDRLRTRRWFNSVLRGILCCFVGLLVSSTLHFGLHLGWTWGLALFCAAGFGALLAGSPLLAVIAAGTAISVLFY